MIGFDALAGTGGDEGEAVEAGDGGDNGFRREGGPELELALEKLVFFGEGGGLLGLSLEGGQLAFEVEKTAVLMGDGGEREEIGVDGGF